MKTDGLYFKIATEPEELKQIRSLNYSTFVEEIPQHRANEERLLTDSFHHENTYFVCRRGNDVIGMIAVKSRRPFSLDSKLKNLDDYLPPHRSSCEIRLLAVKQDHRRGPVFFGLIGMLYRYCEDRGHDLALISGTLRQRKLYQHLGFVPFGPLVGTEDAPYQPMYQTRGSFLRLASDKGEKVFDGITKGEVNLLPGPVFLAPPVQAALEARPISHRSERFRWLHNTTRRMLCQLTGARDVAIALGSGTLANDMIAGQISRLRGRGVILSNGEFGQRLIDHARRFDLHFNIIEAQWGNAFEEQDLLRAVSGPDRFSWMWAVHAETSTGVLNDIGLLKRLCGEYGISLCLDCVSSLGLVEVELSGVHLASGVSGKGLAALSGLALVFYNHELLPSSQPLPRYLDLYPYRSGKIPYTLPSSLLNALCMALEKLEPAVRWPRLVETAKHLEEELAGIGLGILAEESVRFPGALTIPLPDHLNSQTIGAELEEAGWLLSYGSEYLVRRNWIQICLMSESDPAAFEPLIRILRDRILDPRAAAVP